MPNLYSHIKRVGQYRSQAEATVADILQRFPGLASYESETLKYTATRSYIPDFCLGENTYLEVKGRFPPEDRTKMLSVLRDNPGVTIIMVFTNPRQVISKKSKTTYAAWCDKHDIKWCKLTDLPTFLKEHSLV